MLNSKLWIFWTSIEENKAILKIEAQKQTLIEPNSEQKVHRNGSLMTSAECRTIISTIRNWN